MQVFVATYDEVPVYFSFSDDLIVSYFLKFLKKIIIFYIYTSSLINYNTKLYPLISYACDYVLKCFQHTLRRESTKNS